MAFHHASVYVVRVDDTADAAGRDVWLAGPYGATRAAQVAAELQAAAPEVPGLRSRQCTVEPLFSRDDCLHVGGYTRGTGRPHV